MAATNAMILLEIKDLNRSVKALILAEAARCERELNNDKLINEHEHAIKGNSKAGLNTNVQLLQDNMQRVNWVGGAILLMLIGDIISRLLNR